VLLKAIVLRIDAVRDVGKVLLIDADVPPKRKSNDRYDQQEKHEGGNQVFKKGHFFSVGIHVDEEKYPRGPERGPFACSYVHQMTISP
jgi:hypothetical protein